MLSDRRSQHLTSSSPFLAGGHISSEREAKNYVKILTFQNSTHLHSGQSVHNHMPDDDTMLGHIKFQHNTVGDQYGWRPHALSRVLSHISKRCPFNTNISHLSGTGLQSLTLA